jgi:hypothetical protein
MNKIYCYLYKLLMFDMVEKTSNPHPQVDFKGLYHTIRTIIDTCMDTIQGSLLNSNNFLLMYKVTSVRSLGGTKKNNFFGHYSFSVTYFQHPY